MKLRFKSVLVDIQTIKGLPAMKPIIFEVLLFGKLVPPDSDLRCMIQGIHASQDVPQRTFIIKNHAHGGMKRTKTMEEHHSCALGGTHTG